MKRRIAEIVTRFSSEGLADLRRAIRSLADDARRAHSTSDRSVSSGLRNIAKEAGLAREAAAGLNDALSLRGAGRGLSQIGRGLAQISTGSLSLSRTGIVATTESIAVSARTIQRSFSLIGTVAKRQFAGVEVAGKKSFRRLATESRLASRVIESDIVVATRRAGTQALGFLSNAPGLRQTASALTRLRRSATSAFSAIAMTAATLGPRISRPFTVAATGIAAGFRAARPAIARALDLGGEAARAGARITRGFANVGSGVARSLAGIGGAATRAFAGASTAANRAFSGIVRGAGRMAGRSMRDLAKIPLAIIREMGSEQVVLYSAIGAAAAAVYAAWPAIKGFGALGIAGLAGAWTMADLKSVRQGSRALGVPIDVVQQWQYFGNTVGIATDDMVGGMQFFQESITESLDMDPMNGRAADLRNLFKKIGLQTRDAAGQVRPLSRLMLELSATMTRMNIEQKNWTLEQLLGDAQTFAELFDRIGPDGAALQKEFADRQARGIFATEAEINRIFRFQVEMRELLVTVKALARELFSAFIPVFERFMGALEGSLSTLEQRRKVVDAFMRAWVEGFQLFNDFLRVFVGYDLQKEFLGEDSGEIQNTWLITLKKTLTDIWAILVGVGRLLLGLGSIFLQIGQAFDTLVTRFTGFSIEHWIRNTGAEDVLSFFTDLSTIMRNLFRGPFDTSQLETALGRFMGGNAEAFKEGASAFAEPWENALRYVETAIAEMNASIASGSGLANAESTLGQLLIIAREAAVWLGELGRSFETVFLDGGEASGRMEWLNGMKSTFDNVRDVVGEIAAILGPLFSSFNTFTQDFLGINGGTAAILGKIGLDIFSSAPLPVLLVGLAAGVAALFYGWMKPTPEDYATDNNAPATQVLRDRMNRDLDEAGGPKPGARAAFERTSAVYDERDRAFIASAVADGHRQVDTEAGEIAANVEASLGSVDVTASGTPVIINLPTGGSATGIFPTDQADQLQRALGAQIGGR